MRLKGIDVEKAEKAGGETETELGGGGGAAAAEKGVPSPYYPIYLPIDQDFKAKYMWHHRNLAKKGKTWQERVYVFLEHPGGWICFVYHMSV